VPYPEKKAMTRPLISPKNWFIYFPFLILFLDYNYHNHNRLKVEKQGGLRRKETVREPLRPAPVWSSVSSFWSSISMSSNTALFVINLFNNNLVTVSCCLFCRGFCLFSRACDRLLLLCRLRGFRRLHYLTVSVWLSFNLFLFYKDILCFVAQNIMKNLL